MIIVARLEDALGADLCATVGRNCRPRHSRCAEDRLSPCADHPRHASTEAGVGFEASDGRKGFTASYLGGVRAVEGRVVNISSIIASTGYGGLSVYGATKAALVGFTKSPAREVGRVGVTVNAVAPGFIATEMTSSLGDGDRAKIAGRAALKRLAAPEDVANAVAFLLDDNARNVTGAVRTVDAGAAA